MFNSYYREQKLQNNNVKNDAVPLQLNCAGKEKHYEMHVSTVRKDYYLFYLYEGELNVLKPVKASMKSGDMVVFAEDTPFKYESKGETTHFFAHFTGYLSEKLLDQCFIKPATVYELGQSESIVKNFNSIFDSFLIKDDFFDTDISSKLASLFVMTGRKIRDRKKPEISGNLKKLKASLAFINENISKPIQLLELAERENLSVSRYHVLFKSVMKTTPMNYITTLKINAACGLLEKSSLAVSEVAKAVGFEDQRYFARVFKKEKGITPSEYRQI